MKPQRKRLSDILRDSGSGGDDFRSAWDSTQAADDFGPLPPGTYLVRVLSGELCNARQRATPGYKLTLEVAEGEYEGRLLWLDLWLTKAALPMTKRDLAKIGITTEEQLEVPVPPGILIQAKVALLRDDDGAERNRIVRLDPAGIEAGDSFEPGKDAGTDLDGTETPFDVPDVESSPRAPEPEEGEQK
jgi:hypothetical protein